MNFQMGKARFAEQEGASGGIGEAVQEMPPAGPSLLGALCDSLPVAALLVDPTARIRYLNCSAQSALERNNVPLSVRDGRLLAVQRQGTAHLLEAVRLAAGGGRRSALRLQRPRGATSADNPQWNILVSPLACCRAPSAPTIEAVAMVLITDEASPARAGADVIQSLFGLTAAETRLASALMRGITMDEFAELREISIKTARTHLANLFAKTGTRRQADLVALLLGVPAIHADAGE